MGVLNNIAIAPPVDSASGTTWALAKSTRYGLSLGLGYIRGKSPGVPIDRINIGVGIVGNLVGLAFGGAGAHLVRAADTAIADSLCAWSARKGAEAAGRSVAVVKPTPTAVKGWGGRRVLGAIPPAKAGPFLTPAQIAAFAQRR